MNTFSLENPNKHLIRYGVILIAVFMAAYILERAGFAYDTLNVVVGVGVIVRILVLLWMPVASGMVGRNAWFWTISAFIVPSLAFILLGWLGYKETPLYISVFKDSESKFLNKKNEFTQLVEKQELTQNQMDNKLLQYKKELSDLAQKQLSSKQDVNNKKYLNVKLERQGYVMDNSSEVFVEFDNKCPACATSVGENTESCPECGLKLK
jgi:hypothetical protein